MLVKLPEAISSDDKEGKPVGIQKFIGTRPIFAFRNSDATTDAAMAAAGRAAIYGIVHHTDAEREWAYGPRE